jgi:hypothetical protein
VSYLPRKHTDISGQFRHCSNSNAAVTACGNTASRLQVFLILKFAQLYTIPQQFTIKHCTCSESYVMHVLHAYQQICSNAQVMMGMLCCADHAICTDDTTAVRINRRSKLQQSSISAVVAACSTLCHNNNSMQ